MSSAKHSTPPRIQEIDHVGYGLNRRNPKVSERSNFNDNEWNFEEEITSPTQSRCHKLIRWNFKVNDHECFTDQKYEALLLSCKQLLYAMLWQPEQNRQHKPSSLIVTWECVRGFIAFLMNRSYPILNLKDVIPFITDEYKEKLRLPDINGQKIEISTLYTHYRALRRLFQYRFRMNESLQFDPFDGTSPAKEASYTRAYLQQHRTDYIPDEILTPLITTALDYVNIYSGCLLEAAEGIQELRQKYKYNKSRFLYEAKVWLRSKRYMKIVPDVKENRASLICDAYLTRRELEAHLIRLRTSCFILIAFISGMRLSEILSIKQGCIQTEQTADGEFIWIYSVLYKMQGQLEGTSTKWLGGPIASQAVSGLERLTRHIRILNNCPYLFVPVTRVGEQNWSGNILSSAVIGRDLIDYCMWLGLKNADGSKFHLHPHMFRRTFARHVVRSDSTNLLALKEHFKHWSIAMTDGYVGADEELQELLMDEAERLSFETFDKVMSSHRLGGARGKEIVRQINSAIAKGRLPQEFRGEAGTHLRHELIKEMVSAGQQIYVCGSGNYCWYRKDSAMCSKGDLPVIEACNPYGCLNSIIHKEHVPHWEEMGQKTDDLLALNPPGEPYQKRLTNFRKIVTRIIEDAQ